jgi:hypothetical protein
VKRTSWIGLKLYNTKQVNRTSWTFVMITLTLNLTLIVTQTLRKSSVIQIPTPVPLYKDRP